MSIRLMNRIVLVLLSLSIESRAEELTVPELGRVKLLFKEDFESGDLSRYEPTDTTAWKLEKDGDNSVYSLIKRNSDFKPPVRSPLNRCLIRDLNVRSFVMDIRLKSTVADYDHRSLCLFFGYRDDAHLYYVHFGKKTDDHANQIFIVNDEPRIRISTRTTPGTPWDDSWHSARIVRNVETGTITVYFDDLENPVMTANDRRFVDGRVGFGSFDDIGQFDDVRIYVPVE